MVVARAVDRGVSGDLPDGRSVVADRMRGGDVSDSTENIESAQKRMVRFIFLCARLATLTADFFAGNQTRRLGTGDCVARTRSKTFAGCSIEFPTSIVISRHAILWRAAEDIWSC